MDGVSGAGVFLGAGFGVLELLLTIRVLGKNLRFLPFLLYAAAYAALMAAKLPPNLAPLLLVPQVFLLYGAGCLAGASRTASLSASVLSLSLAQSVNGIGSCVLTLVLSPLAGSRAYTAIYWCIVPGMLVLFAGAAWVILKLQPDGADDRTAAGLVLAPLAFFLAAEIFVIGTMPGTAQLPIAAEEFVHSAVLLALQLLELFAIVCTVAASGRIALSIRQKNDLEAFAQAARLQERYAAEAQQRFERTRSFRHDIKNHFRVLRGLLDAGRTDEAREYLSDLQKDAGDIALQTYTGRPAVDVLLNEKINAAEAEGISTAVTAPLPSSVQATNADLCVVFGNAMDNAIAAARASDANRHITVRSARQGAFVLVVFENSTVPGSFIQPGTGLRNIAAAAQKNGGTMQYSIEDTSFVLRVLLACADP